MATVRTQIDTMETAEQRRTERVADSRAGTDDGGTERSA